jgi:hypothetical protein
VAFPFQLNGKPVDEFEAATGGEANFGVRVFCKPIASKSHDERIFSFQTVT